VKIHAKSLDHVLYDGNKGKPSKAEGGQGTLTKDESHAIFRLAYTLIDALRLTNFTIKVPDLFVVHNLLRWIQISSRGALVSLSFLRLCSFILFDNLNLNLYFIMILNIEEYIYNVFLFFPHDFHAE